MRVSDNTSSHIGIDILKKNTQLFSEINCEIYLLKDIPVEISYKNKSFDAVARCWLTCEADSEGWYTQGMLSMFKDDYIICGIANLDQDIPKGTLYCSDIKFDVKVFDINMRGLGNYDDAVKSGVVEEASLTALCKNETFLKIYNRIYDSNISSMYDVMYDSAYIFIPNMSDYNDILRITDMLEGNGYVVKRDVLDFERIFPIFKILYFTLISIAYSIIVFHNLRKNINTL